MNRDQSGIQRLFVYGTLAPGGSNERLLRRIGGSREQGTVTGVLHAEGWGATQGYPALILTEAGEEVRGYLFCSDRLSEHWEMLDAW